MEQKKGFLEDGGGFDRAWDGTESALKRFSHSRYAHLLGMLVIVVMIIVVVLVLSLNSLQRALQNNDLRVYLQHEVGLPESEGLSESEFDELDNVFFALTWSSWPVERSLDEYLTKFGYAPFSETEISVLLEFEHLYDRFAKLVSGGMIWLSTWVGICLMIARWLLRDVKGKKILLVAALGTVIGLVPIVFVAVCFTRDFTGTLHFLVQMLFSSGSELLQMENSLLARLLPERVMWGIARNAAYRIGEEMILIFAVLLAVTLIVIVVDVVSKRNKLKEERE